MRNMIFVFGSNEGGYHGAGAARTAYMYHGAIMGQGEGRMGMSYGIPTKDRSIRKTLPLHTINDYVKNFANYVSEHPELTFQVTRIGCGLAGLRDAEVASLFNGAPDNCLFDELWRPWFGDEYKYWGTF